MNKTLALLSTTFYAVLITLISWIFVHILALAGVFFIVAYPIMWLFFPDKTICFICQAKKDNSWCPLCSRKVNKAKGYAINSVKSVIGNAAIIGLLTFLSLLIVYAENQILEWAGYTVKPKTVSFLLPTKGQYRLDEVFPINIELSGMETPINTVQADISYDPEILAVVDITTEKSFATIFVDKTIDNQKGQARLVGGLPNPGYSGTRGLFATVLMKGKKPGVAEVKYLPTSKVLANDGKGTNVLKDLSSFSYLILPEKISQAEQQKKLQNTVLGESTGETQMLFFAPSTVEPAATLPASGSAQLKKRDVLFQLVAKVDEVILLWLPKLRQ